MHSCQAGPHSSSTPQLETPTAVDMSTAHLCVAPAPELVAVVDVPPKPLPLGVPIYAAGAVAQKVGRVRAQQDTARSTCSVACLPWVQTKAAEPLLALLTGWLRTGCLGSARLPLRLDPPADPPAAFSALSPSTGGRPARHPQTVSGGCLGKPAGADAIFAHKNSLHSSMAA